MIVKTSCKNLLAIARAYAKAENLRLTQVSRRVYGTSNFLADLEKGKVSISIRRYEQMVEWFRDHWSDGAPWPWLDTIRIKAPKSAKIIPVKSHSSMAKESRIA